MIVRALQLLRLVSVSPRSTRPYAPTIAASIRTQLPPGMPATAAVLVNVIAIAARLPRTTSQNRRSIGQSSTITPRTLATATTAPPAMTSWPLGPRRAIIEVGAAGGAGGADISGTGFSVAMGRPSLSGRDPGLRAATLAYLSRPHTP